MVARTRQLTSFFFALAGCERRCASDVFLAPRRRHLQHSSTRIEFRQPHVKDDHLLLQTGDLHLARPQGLWASLRYPVRSDPKLGAAEDTGRHPHRLHLEDDEHPSSLCGL